MVGSKPLGRTCETVNILGTPVHRIDKSCLLKTAVTWAGQGEPRTITYVNAHCLNLASADPAYRALLRQADLVYADGIGAVWASWFLGHRRLSKATGRDWIHDFCTLAVQEELKLFILAGAPGIALSATDHLLRLYPALRIAGCSDGFIQPGKEAQLLEKIERCAPQVLFVGMGAPLQEKWIASHRNQISAPVCWGVGALFDYLAGKETQTPSWMDRVGLEWLWRLGVDPMGKWRRYLLGIPVFMFRVWQQKVGWRSF